MADTNDGLAEAPPAIRIQAPATKDVCIEQAPGQFSMGCWDSMAYPISPIPTGKFFLVGPVVGKVDNTTARILIETAHDSEVDISVMEATAPANPQGPYGPEPVQRFLQRSRGRTPTAFVIKDLKPGYAYRISLTGWTASGAPESSEAAGSAVATFSTFRTDVAGRKDNLRLGFISCNNFMMAERSQVWMRLMNEIKNEGGLDYLVHMGDQVYADGELHRLEAKIADDDDDELYEIAKESAWKQARDYLNAVGTTREEWQKHTPYILEAFRDVYRRTWGAPDVAAVLASVPNIMVLDDHELRDDFGDRPEDLQYASMENFLGWCGLQVYHEYQTQLHRDVNVKDVVGEKCYSTHFLGDERVGIFLMDQRAERSIRKGGGVNADKDWKNKNFLGPGQHEDLMAALEGQFRNVSQLFIVSPTPMILLSEVMTMFLGSQIDDMYGTWNANAYIDERDEIIHALAKWADQDPRRSVAVIAGDIHIGGHSTMSVTVPHEEEDHEYVIHQLTCSAVSGAFYERETLETALASMAMRIDQLAATRSNISVEHDTYQFVNNAGIVSVQMGQTLRPTVTSTLLLGNDVNTDWYDLTMGAPDNTLCTIM